MKKTLSLSCVLVLCYSLHAQTVSTPSAMRYTGIGTYSRHFTDAFSISSNQAALCNLQTPQVGIFTERRFMLQELNFISAVLALPFQNSGVGFTVNHFGFTSYSETMIGVAYGKKLGKKVDIGVQFNYNTVSIAGYGDASAVSIEIGSILHFTDKLTGGIHLYNPSGSKYDKNAPQSILPVCTMGMGYEDGDHFFASIEIAKEQGQPVNVNAGLHYAFYKQFFLRCGIATGVNNSFAGIGIKWSVCRMDLFISYHPQLGFTPALALIFSLKQQSTTSEND